MLFLSSFSTSNCSFAHYPLLRKIGTFIYHNNPYHDKAMIAATSSRLASFCTAVSACAAGDAVSEPTTPVTTAAGQRQQWTKIMDPAGMLDIRVGRILRAWRHGEADSLYVEEVDLGEPEPRIICSGLVNYIPLEHLQVYFYSLYVRHKSWM